MRRRRRLDAHHVTSQGWPGLLCNPGLEEAIGEHSSVLPLVDPVCQANRVTRVHDVQDAYHAITVNQFLHPIRGARYERVYHPWLRSYTPPALRKTNLSHPRTHDVQGVHHTITCQGWPGLLCNPGLQEAIGEHCVHLPLETRFDEQTGPPGA